MTDNKGIVSAENAVGDIEDVKSTLKAAEYGGGMDVSANLLDALASAPDAPDTTHKCFRTLTRAPWWVYFWPAVAFIVLIVGGQLGVYYAARDFKQQREDLAWSQVIASADQVALQLQTISAPNVALASAVKANPYVPTLAQDFVRISSELLKSLDPNGTVTRIQIIPWGHFTGVYPYDTPANLATLNYNFWTDPLRENITRDAVAKGPDYLDIIGPITLIDKTEGFVSRMFLFMPNVTKGMNETFGMDTTFTVPYAPGIVLGNITDPTGRVCQRTCTTNSTTGKTTCKEQCGTCGAPCGIQMRNGTAWRFWGILNAVVRKAPLVAPLELLEKQSPSYKYTLFRKMDGAATDFRAGFQLSEYYKLAQAQIIGRTLGSNITERDNPVCADVSPGTGISILWGVCIVPVDGWEAPWLVPLQIAISFMALIVAALIFFMLFNMHRASSLLRQQMSLNSNLAATNKHLAETKETLEKEKETREVLLMRQYDLISCFAQGNGNLGATLGGSTDSNMSKEDAAIARIENERRALAAQNQGRNTGDELVMQDLLGEGTFGKVYKGLWRGTQVAIKTMILPANMSGQQKREKMAIMEAAISSAMAHPNIVQTYTYSIRPIREAAVDSGTESDFGLDGATPHAHAHSVSHFVSVAGGTTGAGTGGGSGGAVHSYEVRLVSEFCDKGNLRDALNRGAFRTPEGVNYRAVLECAADIAKAMLHLHCNNVLHADLKSRNVMLSSAGGEGRGVKCKVADFGLAVRIESHETHMSGMFQGTLTHMAPEIMMEGRVSKAADVYAFGICMWELYTCARPFQGMPRALLGHQITREHRRPAFPDHTPAVYRDLAERCWAPLPAQRPTFKEVLGALVAMREELWGATPPLAPHALGPENQDLLDSGVGLGMPGFSTGSDPRSDPHNHSVTLEGSTLDASLHMPSLDMQPSDEDFLGGTVVASYAAKPMMEPIGEENAEEEAGEEEEEV